MSNKNNQDRLERLNSALRENLKRRRQQAQARDHNKGCAHAIETISNILKEVPKKDNTVS